SLYYQLQRVLILPTLDRNPQNKASLQTVVSAYRMRKYWSPTVPAIAHNVTPDTVRQRVNFVLPQANIPPIQRALTELKKGVFSSE
ncbi:hypothetical protein GcC1_107020, partial [Golovinomyces cichoracearum]